MRVGKVRFGTALKLAMVTLFASAMATACGDSGGEATPSPTPGSASRSVGPEDADVLGAFASGFVSSFDDQDQGQCFWDDLQPAILEEFTDTEVSLIATGQHEEELDDFISQYIDDHFAEIEAKCGDSASIDSATATAATSAEPVEPTNEPTEKPTAKPTNTPMPAPPEPNDAARDAWLANEVAALADLDVVVLESFFNTPNIIWIRTGGLTSSDAELVCSVVAGDAVDHFGGAFTVRVFGPSGTDDLLARCTR